MGNDNRTRRTRAVVDVDDVIIRAENIVIVGDRNREDNSQVADIESFDDGELENVDIRRNKYYQDDRLEVSEEIHYYGSKRI
ncbi:hypothetical protein ABFG93_22935 (plasmid) [Pseudalkalibacillus hwajinpoensis]|uniref:hypothetical protein n=1 Tax=Guptibacillus hwajinpoensis TaxID=208199 RepID=UPI00325AECE1